MVSLVPSPANPASLDTVFAGCLAGLDAEIVDVRASVKRWGGDTPARVRTCQFDGLAGDTYQYSVQIDNPVFPPEFTGVDVGTAEGSVRGVVESTSQDGLVLQLALDEPLDVRAAMAIQFDPSALLVMLQDRVRDLATAGATLDRTAPLLTAALGLTPVVAADADAVHPSFQDRALNQGQLAAVARALGSPVSLVFGPPGTGKTRVLGVLAATIAETQHRRVLVTAHTNGALDAAMQAVVAAVDPALVAAGGVVRIGKVTKEGEGLGISAREIAARRRDTLALTDAEEARLVEIEAALATLAPPPVQPTLTSLRDHHRARGAARRTPTATAGTRSVPSEVPDARIRRLLLQVLVQRPAGDVLPALTTAPADLLALQHLRRDQHAATAHQASIVGLTLSMLTAHPEIVGAVDVVCVDEGSMAMLPQVLVAAATARSQFVLFGDPLQLSPIVQSDAPIARQWLGRDLFTHLDLADPARDDPRRPMLQLQHRMVPAIARVVSDQFYAGRLETHPTLVARAAASDPRASVVLVDTSATLAVSARKGTSRINPSHVALVAQLLQQCEDEGETSIGIITPFAAQMQLLRQTVSVRSPGFFRRGGFLRTIHRAQGGERRTIILDLVDAPPQLSSFLDARWNVDLPRLLNVALSRAADRLIIVAHTQSLRARYGRSGSLVMQILERCFREGTYCPVTPSGEVPFLPPLTITPTVSGDTLPRRAPTLRLGL